MCCIYPVFVGIDGCSNLKVFVICSCSRKITVISEEIEFNFVNFFGQVESPSSLDTIVVYLFLHNPALKLKVQFRLKH